MASPGPVGIEALLAHRDWARGLARALVRDPSEAEDLEQTAWLEAVRRPPARDEGLRGWFATLLRRRALDLRRGDERRGRREAAAARGDATRSTADVVADAEAHRLVVQALMALEEPFRETLLLRYFEDLPPRSVAARIGVPVETVRSRTRRGLERLRERLDGGQPGGRTAWMALLVPLAGLRGEAAAAAAGASGAGAGTGAAAAATGGAAMAGKATVGVAVLGALAGAVAGGVAVGTVSGGAPGAELEAARAEVAALRGRVETLEAARPSSSAPASAAAERIESQERRIRALEEAAAAPPPRDDRETEPSGEAARRKEIEERLQELARRTDEAARRLAEAKRGEAAGERAPGKDDPRQVFLDRSKSEDERVAALTRVRDARGIDRAIVDAAVELFRASGRPESRERILRDLHGTRDAEVRRLFLEALRSDADEGVRVRAAGDIDTFAEEAEVRTALDAARLGDASEKVRKAALETLRKD